MLFQTELTAGQALQKVVRLGLQARISFGALNTRSDNHPTRLSEWNEGERELWSLAGGKSFYGWSLELRPLMSGFWTKQ
eukprot:1370612-Heterocapsa_arctica.AAC.1